MRKLIAALLLVLMTGNACFGWNDLGHKIVASIAWRQLDNDERDKIIALLSKHPRFAEDFSGRMPVAIVEGSLATKNEWLIQQAAVWPDIARGFPGQLKSKYHRANWHYINQPMFLTAEDRAALEAGLDLNLKLDPPATAEKSMNVVQMLRLARQTLKDDTADDQQQALMLAWLLHGGGDLHQPMHSTALFSRNLFSLGDRGGNQIHTSQRSNLHSLWDTFPGTGGFREARNFSFVMTTDEEFKALGLAAAAELDEKKWLDESHHIATNTAYGPEILSPVRLMEEDSDTEYPPITLTEDYLQAGGRVADRRLVQAGYRLGAILKQVAADN
ncbi:MAG TPA: S1/P1 nuclease [Pirellulaceae bacterium]|nr:S1/P1 nuclease [Pirellulaceae bacterium]